MCVTCVMAIQSSVDERLENDPEFSRLHFQVLRQMNSGFYDKSYIDLVVSRRGRYNIYDAFVFLNFVQGYWSGRFVVCQVGFCDKIDGPRGDAEGGANNLMLAALCPPFTGTFRGGDYFGDGFVEWSEFVYFSRSVQPGTSEVVSEKRVRIAPRKLLLEVGDLHLYNGWHHLSLETGFARWPYGSDLVTCILWDDSEFDRLDVTGRVRIPTRGGYYREVGLFREVVESLTQLAVIQ